MSVFSQKLENIRLQRGWTQRRLAQELGITQGTLSRLLSGDRGPSAETLRRAITILEIPLEDLTVGPAVHEDPAPYTVRPDPSIYMDRLRARWHKQTRPHKEMELAIEILFGDDAPKILAWLNKKD
jgi:transcriptional regulator with XRE-family HTH domain